MSTEPAPRATPLIVRTIAIDDPGDLIDALPEPGLCWVRRGEGMVAWGEAARLDTTGPRRMAEARRWWAGQRRRAVVRDEVAVRGSGLVAFGSFAFADDSAAGGSLVVPRVVLGRRDGVSWLTVVSTDASIAAPSLAEEQSHGSAPASLGAVRVGTGDRHSWSRAVDEVVRRIDAGHVDKVVLARAVEAVSEFPVDARSLLKPLARDYPTCWAFHVEGMVGATPELLARVDRGLVTSRVLAGTIRPSGDETADLAHAAALARSSKDREEHEYAVRSVTTVMERFCTSINVPEAPSVIHLPNVMHLASDVTGVLADATSSLELVEAMHPSAAVCGTPTAQAGEVIAELEDLDRGRYSGPVGWTDAEGDGEWCIALRAAEVSPHDPRRLRLFAGCGIVSASDPGAEWAESEAKLEPLRAALGT